jgi:hypothetical protein
MVLDGIARRLRWRAAAAALDGVARGVKNKYSIRNPRSAIRDPQSAIRDPRSAIRDPQ